MITIATLIWIGGITLVLLALAYAYHYFMGGPDE